MDIWTEGISGTKGGGGAVSEISPHHLASIHCISEINVFLVERRIQLPVDQSRVNSVLIKHTCTQIQAQI